MSARRKGKGRTPDERRKNREQKKRRGLKKQELRRQRDLELAALNEVVGAERSKVWDKWQAKLKEV